MKRLIPLLVLLFVVNGCRSAKPAPPLEPAPLVIKEQASELFCPPPCNLAPYAKPGEVVLLPPMPLGEAQKLVEPTKPPAPDQRVPGAFLRRVGARARAVKTLSKGGAKVIISEPPADTRIATTAFVATTSKPISKPTKTSAPVVGPWWLVIVPCGLALLLVLFKIFK